MRHTPGIPALLAALALAWALAGCGRSAEQAAPPAGGGAPAATGAAPGTQQAAGPFQVTLYTDLAATAGGAHFNAKISRNNLPVTDATVKLSLSMPSMKMAGPEVTLKPGAAGEYDGTASLSMTGDWQAEMTVSAHGETGTATYRLAPGQ